MKICFMGTPQIGANVLKELLKHCEIQAVYTKAPKAQKRGLKVHISKVHEVAIEYNIPVYHPKNFKNNNDVLEFVNQQFDLAIVVAYGLILPPAIFQAPKHGTINLHGSLLPKWRGAAPIERCIEAGDSKTGPTIMYIEEGLDSGNIIFQEDFPITITTTASQVYKSMAEVGSKLLIKTINLLKNNHTLPSIPQDHNLATYAKMLKKEEGKINFNQPAINIIHKINAFENFPGSYFEHNNETFKILKASIVKPNTIKDLNDLNINNMPPSQLLVIKDSIYVTTTTDLIKIEIIQRAGKKPLNSKSFLIGYSFKGITQIN